MKTKKLLAAFAMGFVILMSGCAKDDFNEVIGVCPVVITTSPLNEALNVPLDQIITVTFNEEMDSETITQASFTLLGDSGVAGTVSYSGTTATFTPSTLLTADKTYTARIATTVKDLKGNALQIDYIWTFSTGTSITPMVVSTDPINNATGVVLNKIVQATFNMPMDPLTLNASNFSLKQGTTVIAGTITFLGTSAFFKPTLALAPNTIYTGTITTGVKNNAGIALASNYVWSFTTGTTTAPIVISSDPINNATGVSLNKIVTATFNMPMDPLTITTSNFTLKQGTIAVAGSVSYSGSTASFNPTSDLLASTTYTATISTGTKNLAGIALANDYVWTFNTGTSIITNPIVNLASAARFGILSGVGISNNAGFSEIHNMDVGISPGVRSSITGFPPAIIVNGAIYASDDSAPLGIAAMLIEAKQDLTNAYLFAEGASSPAPATVSGDIGGLTLAPGIYKSTSTLLIQSGDVTLDAQGDANAVWIFQIASDFTTVGGAGGNVILSGGAQAKNIFWQTGSSATIGDYTIFKGNILALTSITMNSHATAEGRMLARNGSVVMTHTNTITKP